MRAAHYTNPTVSMYRSARAGPDGRHAVRSDPILIVGGGLGGLTTALALARHGIASRVLEGAPEFGAIGYGIQFGPNVFHVLDRIGVSDAVMDKADCPPAVLMRDAFTGDELARIPTGASFRARFKHPYIIIHRIDLHNVLLDACRRTPRDRAGAGCHGHRPSMITATGVAVTTADGRSFSGAALVAADGLRSFCARSSSTTASRARSAMSRIAPSCRCRS